MKATAIMMLAIHENLVYKKYLIQAATQQEQFPDVYTIYQKEHPVETKWQTIEVVGYEEHSSSIDIGQFILNKKLLKKKNPYDEDTIILCNILKDYAFVDYNDVLTLPV